MKGSIGWKTTKVFLTVWLLIIALYGTAFAIGEYDGVWLGPETVNVPGYGSMTETTGTVVYQEDLNTLTFWDPMFGAVTLLRNGSQWILAAPILGDYMGYSAKFTSIVITFPSTSYLTGTITAEIQGVVARGTLSHTRQSCQTLINGSALSGLSGAMDSLRCYEINLPMGATNLDVRTWGGFGDCDVIQIFHRPDFDYYTSDNLGNDEQIAVASPKAGKWYIGLAGWESYSGLNLKASYNVPPPPISNYTADTLMGNVPLTVNFTDQSVGINTSWTWDFGDGTTSINRTPVHTYSDVGKYTVTLTVTGPAGTDIEIKTGYIIVNEVKAMPWILLLLKDKDE